MKKTELVQFNCTPDMKAWLKERSQDIGLSMSSYIVFVLREIQKETERDETIDMEPNQKEAVFS